MTFSGLIASLLTLAIVGYAFVMIVAGPRGTQALNRSIGKGIGSLLAWLFSVLWRLMILLVVTGIDLLITLFLMIYHVATVRKYDMLGDDFAGFLTRFNDRLFSIMSK